MNPGEPGKLSLPRERRIKQGRDFARARNTGKRIANGCLVANWVELPAGAASRVGVIASRKVGESVVRSRARRLLREAFRLHQTELKQPLDVVLVARPSIVGKSFGEVEKDFLTALRRAQLIKETG
jgi:ribonuclease P protein component